MRVRHLFAQRLFAGFRLAFIANTKEAVKCVGFELDRFLYKIDQLLQARRPGVVPIRTFLDELEVSLATFKRDLEYMRDRFNAPIAWDADAGGYRYGSPSTTGPRFALPGLWFNEGEAFALVMMEHLLASLDQGGLIGPHIAPLRARLTAILGTGEASAAEVRKRVRASPIGSKYPSCGPTDARRDGRALRRDPLIHNLTIQPNAR